MMRSVGHYTVWRVPIACLFPQAPNPHSIILTKVKTHKESAIHKELPILLRSKREEREEAEIIKP